MNRLHLLLLVAALMLGGCIEREMTITSEPEGSLVFVSDVEVGRTPLTMPFTWYGDYDVILRHEGCETLKTHAHVNAPWYGLPPADFFASIAPWTIHDRRYLHFTMEEARIPTDEQLLENAEAFRQRTAEEVR